MKTNPTPHPAGSVSTPARTRPAALLLAAGVCSALALTTSVPAQTTNPYPAQDPMPEARERGDDSLDRGDRAFLEDASEAGLEAVAIGQTVLPRLSNPSIRTFAEQVVSDQSRIRQDIRTLAARKGVTLPVPDPTDRVEKWSVKTEGVDKDYLDAVIDHHEEAIDRFEDAADSDDADIASYAQRTVIALKTQLEQAKAVRKAHS